MKALNKAYQLQTEFELKDSRYIVWKQDMVFEDSFDERTQTIYASDRFGKLFREQFFRYREEILFNTPQLGSAAHIEDLPFIPPFDPTEPITGEIFLSRTGRIAFAMLGRKSKIIQFSDIQWRRKYPDSYVKELRIEPLSPITDYEKERLEDERVH